MKILFKLTVMLFFSSSTMAAQPRALTCRINGGKQLNLQFDKDKNLNIEISDTNKTVSTESVVLHPIYLANTNTLEMKFNNCYYVHNDDALSVKCPSQLKKFYLRADPALSKNMQEIPTKLESITYTLTGTLSPDLMPAGTFKMKARYEGSQNTSNTASKTISHIGNDEAEYYIKSCNTN